MILMFNNFETSYLSFRPKIYADCALFLAAFVEFTLAYVDMMFSAVYIKWGYVRIGCFFVEYNIQDLLWRDWTLMLLFDAISSFYCVWIRFCFYLNCCGAFDLFLGVFECPIGFFSMVFIDDGNFCKLLGIVSLTKLFTFVFFGNIPVCDSLWFVIVFFFLNVVSIGSQEEA